VWRQTGADVLVKDEAHRIAAAATRDAVDALDVDTRAGAGGLRQLPVACSRALGIRRSLGGRSR